VPLAADQSPESSIRKIIEIVGGPTSEIVIPAFPFAICARTGIVSYPPDHPLSLTVRHASGRRVDHLVQRFEDAIPLRKQGGHHALVRSSWGHGAPRSDRRQR
jgi:hypothetical protein